MEFFGISKQEAELRISETPLHQQNTSYVESDLLRLKLLIDVATKSCSDLIYVICLISDNVVDVIYILYQKTMENNVKNPTFASLLE